MKRRLWRSATHWLAFHSLLVGFIYNSASRVEDWYHPQWAFFPYQSLIYKMPLYGQMVVAVAFLFEVPSLQMTLGYFKLSKQQKQQWQQQLTAEKN